MKKFLISFLAALLAAAPLMVVAANTATITFNAVTTYANGDSLNGATVQYNIYQGVGVGSTKVKIGTISTTTGSITTGLLSGNKYCFQVTAQLTTAGATESELSNEACKSFDAPSKVTITVT